MAVVGCWGVEETLVLTWFARPYSMFLCRELLFLFIFHTITELQIQLLHFYNKAQY